MGLREQSSQILFLIALVMARVLEGARVMKRRNDGSMNGVQFPVGDGFRVNWPCPVFKAGGIEVDASFHMIYANDHSIPVRSRSPDGYCSPEKEISSQVMSSLI